VARSVADQIERRISHRRAIKQAVGRAMQRGALGIRIKVAGRLGGSEMSRRDQDMQGRIPLHTLKAQIDYGTTEARTTLGRIGVKCWIYKGDAPVELRRRQAAERAAAAEEEAAEAEGAAAATAPTSAEPSETSAPAPQPEAESDATT
ncbi:MAG TPA: 30S ribosomal protein S3, partial [Dehalococcoidia bacterium]|nr:30S ribosomal protein S3 [Dehalococcoidia bacterium]